MIRTVEKRILIFAFAVLCLTLAVDNVFSIRGFRNDYRDGILLRCRFLATSLKTSVEKVLSLGIRIDEIEGIGTRCQQIVAGDPEIRYCLIEDARGTVLYANDLALLGPGSANFLKATDDPTTTLLDVPIFGTVYDISAPLLAPDGSVAGRVRLGFPQSVLTDITFKVLRRTVMILVSALIAVFVIVALFVRRDLVGPIRRLCTVAEQIADGNFKVAIPAMSTREFEQLGAALQEMADSLRERDVKIQDSYAELELANRELLSSYEHQERISIELAANREMYRALLEHASDAILVVDDEDVIVLMNRAAEAFFGLSRSESEGRNFFVVLSVLCGERVEREYEALQQVRSGALVESELLINRAGSGERIVGWVRGSVVSGVDGRRMVQLTIRDVTRDREVKENLERLADDLQRLNKMKNSFLGMASHELKTPLTVISGYSELLLGEMSDKLDKNILPMIRYIADASDRLTAIVRDMVDVSLLDRRQLLLRKRNVDFNEVVGAATREMEFFFQVRKQHLQLELASDLPLLNCDPDRVFQVISNLVGNAVKFTPDGGTITLQTRLIRTLRAPRKAVGVSETEPIDLRQHSYIELIVKDSGIGIDLAEQTQIFDKFYEIGKIEEHFTGKMAFKGRGTGLGLTIVKGIVDRHGGALWVDSIGHNPETYPGSAFHVILPLAPPAEEPED